MLDSLHRRQIVLWLASSIAGGRLPYDSADKGGIDIALYVTEHAATEYGISNIYQLATVVEETFNAALEHDDVSILVEGTVNVPEDRKTEAEDSAEWWQFSGIPSSDVISNLLLFSLYNVSWNYYGYGKYQQPYAVSAGYEGVGKHEDVQQLAIHEVSHNFNLQHEDHTVVDGKASIMHPNPFDNDAEPGFFFSDKSKSRIRTEIYQNE